MREVTLLLASALWLLCAPAAARAQSSPADAEAEAVKKVVETYLYTEEVEEKKQTLHGEAQIVFVDARDALTRVVPVAKRKAERRSGQRTLRSPQRVVAVDVLNDAASVKVSTELPGEAGESALKHFQYLWLLKVKGDWKIVGILMPTVVPPGPAGR